MTSLVQININKVLNPVAPNKPVMAFVAPGPVVTTAHPNSLVDLEFAAEAKEAEDSWCV